MRVPGPDISGSILREKNLQPTQPELLQQAAGLRPERLMCGKVGQPNFECQTEMEFPTAEEARALKLPPGTSMALHKCSRPGSAEGVFVPVRDVQHAMEEAKKFCDCVRSGGKKAPPPPPPPKPKVERDLVREKCARRK